MGPAGSTFEGKTLDEAVRKGLDALGLTRAEAAITVVEEGSGGFLGFGARPFKVRVMPRPGGAIREAAVREDDDRRSRDRGGRGRDRGRGRGGERGRGGDRGRERGRGGRGDEGRRDDRGQPALASGRGEGSADRGDRAPRAERGDRGDRPDRGPREGRGERGGREAGPDRGPRGERGDRGGRPERGTRGGREERRREDVGRAGGERRRGDDTRRGDEARTGADRPVAAENGRDLAAVPPAGMEPRPYAGPPDGEAGSERGGRRRRRRGRRGGMGRGAGAGEGAVMTMPPSETGMPVEEAAMTEQESDMGDFEAAAAPPMAAGAEGGGSERGGYERGGYERGGSERGRGSAPPSNTPMLTGDALAAEGKRWTEQLLGAMGFEATLRASVDGDRVTVVATIEDGENLIAGERDEVRQAMQQILNRMINRGEGSRYHLQLEVNDFWEKREADLKALATRLADEALEKNGEVVTDYLNAQERRIIHVALRDDTRVKTWSLGIGHIKRLAVAPADHPGGPAGEN